MSLDQRMIASVLNSLRVLNVRFRGSDITDEIREQLRPLMKDLDANCIAYIQLLREPETITTTKELNEYRTIVKNIRLIQADLLPAKVEEMVLFINDRISDMELIVIVEVRTVRIEHVHPEDDADIPDDDNSGTPEGEHSDTPDEDDLGTPNGDDGDLIDGDDSGTPNGDNSGTPDGGNSDEEEHITDLIPPEDDTNPT